MLRMEDEAERRISISITAWFQLRDQTRRRTAVISHHIVDVQHIKGLTRKRESSNCGAKKGASQAIIQVWVQLRTDLDGEAKPALSSRTMRGKPWRRENGRRISTQKAEYDVVRQKPSSVYKLCPAF